MAITFQRVCGDSDIQLKPIPSNRHIKNAIKRMYSMKQSLFGTIRDAFQHTDSEVREVQAVIISKTSDRSDMLSALKITERYVTKIHDNLDPRLPNDVADTKRYKLATCFIQSKRCFRSIMCSNVVKKTTLEI